MKCRSFPRFFSLYLDRFKWGAGQESVVLAIVIFGLASVFCRPFEAEMPFPDVRCPIASASEERGDGHSRRFDQRKPVRHHNALFKLGPPCISPREEAVARRRAQRRGEECASVNFVPSAEILSIWGVGIRDSGL